MTDSVIKEEVVTKTVKPTDIDVVIGEKTNNCLSVTKLTKPLSEYIKIPYLKINLAIKCDDEINTLKMIDVMDRVKTLSVKTSPQDKAYRNKVHQAVRSYGFDLSEKDGHVWVYDR
jgi:hypothetical protein